jgi:hypothetical protein
MAGGDYAAYAMYQQAMRAYGDEQFARWLCETHPWGGVDIGHARIRYLTQDLADFRQYPPAENDRQGPCLLCAFPVPAHKGLVALGGRDGRNYAACLHRGCAGEARRVQDETRRAR